MTRTCPAQRGWVQRLRLRARGATGLLFCGSGALILLVAGCGASPDDSPVESSSGPALQQHCERRLGEADAQISIQTVLPVGSGCQDGIGLYLAGLAEAYPELFQVRIHDMKSAQGRSLMRAQGIRCAAVLVDGSTRFDLGEAHGKVLLEGPMNPLDVYHVLCLKLTESGRGDLELPVPQLDEAPSPEQRRRAGF